MSTPAVLRPGEIAGVETRNRIIRSSTSETMADDRGIITQQYHDFHTRLARNGVGLIFTGHCSVHPRGNYIRGMTALDRDEVIGPMKKLTDAIHAEGGKIFAQLNHAGSQSRDESIEPLAPSVVENPQFHRLPLAAASSDEIWEAIEGFGSAARRVREAGFDGVHVHAGHGYLLSEFLSPATQSPGGRVGRIAGEPPALAASRRTRPCGPRWATTFRSPTRSVFGTTYPEA